MLSSQSIILIFYRCDPVILFFVCSCVDCRNVCTTVYVWKSEDYIVFQSSLSPCLRQDLLIICCVYKASWPMSFQKFSHSLPQICYWTTGNPDSAASSRFMRPLRTSSMHGTYLALCSDLYHIFKAILKALKEMLRIEVGIVQAEYQGNRMVPKSKRKPLVHFINKTSGNSFECHIKH